MFAASELQASHWRFLMGAVGNQATYMRQVNRVIKQLRNDLTLDSLRRGIDSAPLPDHLKDLASARLDLAAEYIDDSARPGDLIRPGRLTIVDLRDEFIEKDEALGLFVVLLQLFADATDKGKAFNKLVIFDEAHKYIESPDLMAGLIEVVREMRHKGTSIMIASQDPPSVPVSLIELSSQIILHKFNSPAWLQHQLQGCLGHPVTDRRDTQVADLAARLGYRPAPHRQWPEGTGFEILPQFGEESFHAPYRLDVTGCLPVHSGGACSLVAPHPIPGHQEESGIGDKIEQIVEPAMRLITSPAVQLGLDLQYPDLGRVRADSSSSVFTNETPDIPVLALPTCWPPSPCACH